MLSSRTMTRFPWPLVAPTGGRRYWRRESGSSPAGPWVRRFAAGPLLLGAFALAGCVSQRCFENLDCPAPEICGVSGACVYECSSDGECGPGFACEHHRCSAQSRGPVHCGDDMVAVANAFCVDRYESSRPDATSTDPGTDGSRAQSLASVLPWQVADNAAAEAACLAAGKRLCTPEEWRTACRGPDDTVYSYGDTYQPTACNGIDAFGRSSFHLMPTGSFPSCTNEWGLFDINGNLWEHVHGGENATVRGGAYNCGDSAAFHRCDYVPGNWTPSARGFRCCMTPENSETPDAGPSTPATDAGVDGARRRGTTDDG